MGSGICTEKSGGIFKGAGIRGFGVSALYESIDTEKTGMLIKSGTLGTVIGSGSIEYLAPYARRQYYEHKTKARWFETMKASHKDAIREGAEKLAGQ